MDSEELIEKIKNLTIWKNGDQRAPHKPLLILYALGQIQNKGTRFIRYDEARQPLTDLLKEFGPYRKTYRPEHPFVRLSHDGIWTISSNVKEEDITNSKLIRNNIYGGFTDEVYKLLRSNPVLIRQIAEIILENHFPETIHEDILSAVGLDLENLEQKQKVKIYTSEKIRDSNFREKILRAYEYSCAICGFNVRLGNQLVAVEAAHIKWHQAGGPDIEENGIALCTMHHKLYDLGVFTINESRRLLVAEQAHGGNGFEDWLMRYHGKYIKPPINPSYQPNNLFLNWHVREVFKGPARYT